MKRLLNVFAALCMCLTMHAQTAAHGKNYYVNYVSQTWLAQNADDVWLVKLNVEWPLLLEGYTMPALQAYLAEHLLGTNATTFHDSFAQLYSKTGLPILQMPNDGRITRHYLNATLQMTHHEAGRYVSFFLNASETDSNGKATRSEKRYFTYDITGDRILTAQDVFHTANMAGTYDNTCRIVFENDIAQNAQCAEAEMANIDLQTLPLDFSLEGSNIRFGLGGSSNNFSWVSTERMEQLSLFNRKFLKYLKGEDKKKKASEPANIISQPFSQQDYFVDQNTDSIFYAAEEMPRFAEGNDSLFSYIGSHISLPQADCTTSINGRVIVSFVVEKDGSLSNFAVLRSINPQIDRASVDVLRGSKPWLPGKKNGQPVRAVFTMPIIFQW